jgi:hypothetical protein
MFSSGETKHRPWNSYPQPVLRGTLPVACSITGCAPVHESCGRYIGFANLCKPVRSCRLPQFRTPTRFQGLGEHFLHLAAILSPSFKLDGTASGALSGDRQTQACRIQCSGVLDACRIAQIAFLHLDFAKRHMPDGLLRAS